MSASVATTSQEQHDPQQLSQQRNLSRDHRYSDISLQQVKQVASRFEADIPVVDMDYQRKILYAAGFAGTADAAGNTGNTGNIATTGITTATADTADAADAAGKRAFFELNSNIWKERGSKAAYLGTGRHGGGIVLRIMFVEVDGHWFNVATGQSAPFSEKEFDF